MDAIARRSSRRPSRLRRAPDTVRGASEALGSLHLADPCERLGSTEGQLATATSASDELEVRRGRSELRPNLGRLRPAGQPASQIAISSWMPSL